MIHRWHGYTSVLEKVLTSVPRGDWNCRMSDPAAGRASPSNSNMFGAGGSSGALLSTINEYLEKKEKPVPPPLQADVPKGILFRPVQWTEAQAYDGSYNKLQTWICNSLEIYKPELLSISFPMFVHSFLYLIQKGYTEEASAFLKKWSPEHLEYHEDEIRSLTMIQTAEQLQGHTYAQRAMAGKFVVRMCVMSFRLLESFLTENSLLVVLEILNKHVKVIVEDRPPRLKREIVCLAEEGVTPAQARDRPTPQVAVRWRVSVPIGSLASEAPPTTDAYNTSINTLRRGARLHKFLSSADQAGPSPPADMRNPTVLMATVTNTYDNMISARITTDATQVACGFQDRSVRVYRLITAEGPAGSAPVPRRPLPSSMDVDDEQDVTYRGPVELRGHSQPVYGLSWSPEQRHLMSCSGDGTARLWDVQSGRNVSVYRGPALWPMWDVAFSPMGHYFATASYSRTAMLWVTTQPQPVRLLVGHYSDVSCVTWHPNCNYVATGSWDKSARLWDVLTGKCVRVFNGHVGPLSSITFSPDGKYVAASASGATAAGSAIRVWEITSGREVCVLEGHTKFINRLAYLNDGKVLASAGSDDSVRTWDMDADLHLLPSAISIAPSHSFMTRGTPVYDVAFTDKNLLLAVGAV